MKLITFDMALASILLVVNVIGRIKKKLYDIYVNDNDFNEMGFFYVRRLAVKKETYLSAIYNISHPCPDSIW